MSKNKTLHSSGNRSQGQGMLNWLDDEARKNLRTKRLAQKESYTDENKELIERLINHVQKI